MAIRILSDQNVTSNVIAIQAFRLGTDSLWKIRGNSASTELAFEYSTSSALSDANIKVVFNSSGDVGIGDNVTPSQKLHVAGNIYSINSGTDGGQIRLANSGGGSLWYWAARTTGLNLGELGVADGNIFIANGGNVGIDTTDQTPEKFNVDGNIIMVGGSTNTGYDRYFKIYGNTQPVNNPNRWAGMAVYNNGGNNVNELAFFTGSGDDARTEKVRIDSGGRVGIGTDDPQSKLQIVDEVSTSIKMYSTYNYSLNRNWAIQLNGFGPGNWGGISFLQSTAQDLAPTVPVFGITRAGNVGIGINASNTAVDQKLHVNGSIKIANTNSRLVFGTSGGTDRRALEGNVDGTLLQVGEGYSDITMYGDVGIGTTNPAYALDVDGMVAIRNSTGPQLLFFETGSAYTDGMRLLRYQDKLSLTYGWNANEEALTVVGGTGSDVGNVGIGTTSPSVKLQVQQDQTAESNVIFMNNSTGANAAIRLSLNVGNPAGDDPKISFNVGDGGLDWTIGVDNSDSDKFKISGGTDSHNPNLGTNDRLVIESSGDVGIGTDAPTKRLDIRTDNGVLIRGATGSTNAGLSFLPASGGRQYDLGNNGSNFQIRDVSANLTRMFFHYNGRLAIGDDLTDPLGKVDIYRPAGQSGTAAIAITNGESNGKNWGISTEVIAGGDFAILQSASTGGTPTPSAANVRLRINNAGDALFYREIFAATATGTTMRVPRNLFVSYGGSSYNYTFDPVALFGSNPSGGTLGLRVSGWPTRLFDGIIIWRNDGGGSSKIGTGVVTLVTVATNDFSGVGVTVSLPSANTNEIKISFSGFHSNNHGWECYIKTEY